MKSLPIKKYTVTESQQTNRLDQFLVSKLQISRAGIQKKIHRGEVLVNEGIMHAPGLRLRAGDTVKVTSPANEKTIVMPAAEHQLPVKIISEAVNYLVVEKPAGMLTHATRLDEHNTLGDWIISAYPDITHIGEDSRRPGIVQRLDKDVSGLIVVAKTQSMFEHLKQQFQQHRVKKEYLALVKGHLLKAEGRIEFAIARSEKGHRMTARPMGSEGKQAVTEYEVLEYLGKTSGEHHGYSLLRVTIHTGRTHQIRAHMHGLGHPIIGDPLYRIKKQKRRYDMGRLFLHAQCLGFYTEESQWVEFESSTPEELKQFLTKLRG